MQKPWEAANTAEALRERCCKQKKGEVHTLPYELWLLRTGWRIAKVAEQFEVTYHLRRSAECYGSCAAAPNKAPAIHTKVEPQAKEVRK